MSTDPFERALRQWEALRDVEALRAQVNALREAFQEQVRPLYDEIERIETETYPQAFKNAMWDADLSNEYYRLRSAGVVSFDDLSAATDDDLLAIHRIGPATLERLREFERQHAS
jgi:hypothetical protein